MMGVCLMTKVRKNRLCFGSLNGDIDDDGDGGGDGGGDGEVFLLTDVSSCIFCFSFEWCSVVWKIISEEK